MEIQESEVAQLEEKLIEAITTSDIVLLDRLLHEDLLFMAPNGQTITKAVDLASHKAGEMEVEKIVPKVEEIRIIGDTAVVAIVYDTKGKMLGNPIQGQFRYIRVWKRFDDGMKVIGGSCIRLD